MEIFQSMVDVKSSGVSVNVWLVYTYWCKDLHVCIWCLCKPGCWMFLLQCASSSWSGDHCSWYGWNQTMCVCLRRRPVQRWPGTYGAWLCVQVAEYTIIFAKYTWDPLCTVSQVLPNILRTQCVMLPLLNAVHAKCMEAQAHYSHNTYFTANTF